MPKYGFLVVEGPHDAELAYRLLSPFGIKRLRQEADVDLFLKKLIPTKYPPDGDLQKRMRTPLFVASDTHALAICRADGDTRIVEAVQENLSVLVVAQLTGMGIILDADKEKTETAAARYEHIRTRMAALGHPLPAAAGQVSSASPKAGAFVLPDNASSGTLEDLLLECATTAYPVLLASATTHVTNGDGDKSLTRDDRKDLEKPSGRNKAVVGAIASILRPGKAIQVSIQDNKWLRGDCLALARIKAVQDFLVRLFDLLPAAAPAVATPPASPPAPQSPTAGATPAAP